MCRLCQMLQVVGGAGAVCLPQSFMFKWLPDLVKSSIPIKELVPVVTAAALYGKNWERKTFLFLADNRVVVDIINNTHSRESHLSHLIRLLVFYACYYDFWFQVKHISGNQNIWADALSHNNLTSFSQVPSANPQQSVILPPLLSLLVLDAAWRSTPWMELFRLSLRLV